MCFPLEATLLPEDVPCFSFFFQFLSFDIPMGEEITKDKRRVV